MKGELAKKLKDAGFPVKGDTLIKGYKGEFVPFPTLSELISACGDKFMLVKFKGDSLWYSSDDIDSYADCEGKTPEEAVANLWLELNKKYGEQRTIN
jgi:hypothetical protein